MKALTDKLQYKMNCNQKLCQRTTNLNSDGSCNVCDKVIKENNRKHEQIEQNNCQGVEVDFKHMLAEHKKLVHGKQVDQHVLSHLLLGGVINTLAHHDTIAEIDKKVKLLEHEQVTNKSRIEALENWVLKQNDLILELEQNLTKVDQNGVIENVEMENVKKKIVSLEIDAVSLKQRPPVINLQEKNL